MRLNRWVLLLVALVLVAVGFGIGWLVAPGTSSPSAGEATVLPTPPPTQIVESATEDDLALRKMAIQQVIDEAFNAGNIEILSEIFAPEFVGHLPASEIDRAEMTYTDFEEALLLLRVAVPDLKMFPEILLAEGQFVAVRARLQGTFVSEYYDYPPTNEMLDLVFTAFFRFNDEDQVVEGWIAYDTEMLEQQLGRIDPSGEA